MIRARFYGKHRSVTLTGPQIRARLSLFDSWMYFSVVKTAQARDYAKAKLSGPVFPQLVLAGSFDPAPRGRMLRVERRSGGHWRRVGSARVSRSGSYRVRVSRRGTYRVRAGSVAGPPARVR